MKILLIPLALLAGLVYISPAYAIPSMTPWQLFQYLCAYVSPGSPQCVQLPQQAIIQPPSPLVQQQTTTALRSTNPNYPVSQQLQQEQQMGPPPDGP
jgi:hypothetical protein